MAEQDKEWREYLYAEGTAREKQHLARISELESALASTQELHETALHDVVIAEAELAEVRTQLSEAQQEIKRIKKEN